MKVKILVIIVLAFLGGLLFSKWIPKLTHKSESVTSGVTSPSKQKNYQCPMHPSIISDHPGSCPICGMRLQKIDEALPLSERPPKVLYYRNPMNPEITSKNPAKDSMGMDYIPVLETEGAGETSQVKDRAAFTLSKERQQMIGLTTALVILRPLSSEVRANGSVAFDPELFSALSEYKQAVLARGNLKANGFPELKDDANKLVSASRTRLGLLGLTSSQINQLGSPQSSPLSLLLPKGQVWIYVEVFEYEVASLKTGQLMEVTTPSIPDQIFRGKIASISPVLNPVTRTIRVRGLVPNPDGVLRPDSYVNVVIKNGGKERLSVPIDSILHSGEKDFVFVVKKEGHFEPREVKVGIKTQDFGEILSGLAVNETVVTAAAFLIDSESRLRSILQNNEGLK